MANAVSWYAGASLPELWLWWTGPERELLDLAAATLNEVRIGLPGSPAIKTKTSGVTLQTGSGTEPDGTPNVIVAWGPGDLDITPGTYTLQVEITMDGLARIHSVPIVVRPVVLPAA